MSGRTIKHALIMAAGRGNRMRPLTDNMPKAMLPYKGNTLIGNSLTMLQDCVEYIHVTVGYQRSLLAQHLMAFGVNSIFNTEGHNNSWWIHHTLMQYLDEPVLVLTCDNITELDMDFIVREYKAALEPACMLVPVIPIPNIEGDYIEHNQQIVLSVQRNQPKDIYCSGIQVLNPKHVVTLVKDPDNFYSVWNQLIQLRQIRVANVYPYRWFSVDTIEQFENLPST